MSTTRDTTPAKGLQPHLEEFSVKVVFREIPRQRKAYGQHLEEFSVKLVFSILDAPGGSTQLTAVSPIAAIYIVQQAQHNNPPHFHFSHFKGCA